MSENRTSVYEHFSDSESAVMKAKRTRFRVMKSLVQRGNEDSDQPFVGRPAGLCKQDDPLSTWNLHL